MKFIYTALLLSINLMLTAQSYQSAESVEYDASQNRWLVANGNNILQRASDGTLTFFGSGSGSHGMEVMGNYVFVCDGGSSIKGYDLVTAQEVMNLAITGASFLNGLTNDGAGILYATDFSGKKIYKIDASDINNPTFEILIANTVQTPNGILYDGTNNRLLWVTWTQNASIQAVDLSDNSMSTVQTTALTNIDGIDEDSEQNYYISSWSPARITKFDKDFANPAVTVTTPAINRPADIGYSKTTDTLAIPMGGNVIFVGLGTTTNVQKLDKQEIGLTIFPNPVSDQSVVRFELERAQTANLTIYNFEGKIVRKLLEGRQPQGLHQVVLTGIVLGQGAYICQLETERGLRSMQFVVE